MAPEHQQLALELDVELGALTVWVAGDPRCSMAWNAARRVPRDRS